VLPAGRVVTLTDPALNSFPTQVDKRKVRQIVIKDNSQFPEQIGAVLNLAHIAGLTEAAGKPPALSNNSPMVTANREAWTAGAASFGSATAAHQAARYGGGIALAAADAADPVNLAGVL
jgi:hypothetical protein